MPAALAQAVGLGSCAKQRNTGLGPGAAERERNCGGLKRSMSVGRGHPRGIGLKLRCRPLAAAANSIQAADQPTSGATRTAVLAIALPAVGIVIADPLMSLIDTAAIGQMAGGPLNLAALGACSVLFNFTFQLFNFLGVSTTNQVSSNSVSGDHEHAVALSTAVSDGLHLALALGCSVTIILLVAGPFALEAIGLPAGAAGPATAYCRIRAMAAPAALTMAVLSGACIGLRDVRSPLAALVAAGALNAALDYLAVAHFGWGLAGVAAATGIAQVAGATVLAAILWRRRSRGQLPAIRSHGFPPVARLRPWRELASVLAFRACVGMSGYVLLAHLAAGMGARVAAVHQVTTALFWAQSYVPLALSLSAQTLLARDVAAGMPSRVRATARWLLGAAFVLAGGQGALAAALHVGLTGIFTADIAMQAALSRLWLPATSMSMLCAVVLVLDGIALGSNDTGHLALNSALATAAAAACLAAGLAAGWGHDSLLWALASSYIFRGILHAAHAARTWPSHALGGGGREMALQAQAQPSPPPSSVPQPVN